MSTGTGGSSLSEPLLPSDGQDADGESGSAADMHDASARGETSVNIAYSSLQPSWYCLHAFMQSSSLFLSTTRSKAFMSSHIVSRMHCMLIAMLDNDESLQNDAKPP